jgi:hypothetical protein
MGILIEVPKAPNYSERFLVCVPANVYAGPKSMKFVTLLGASQRIGKDWTGRMSLEIAQRVFDDFTDAANKGLEAEWMKSIRVTKYHANAQGAVILPREVEQVAAEPEVLPVAQGSDGAWRVIPTEGFKKGLRDWVYSGAFVDSYGEPRIIQTMGPTKLAAVLKLFGTTIPPYVAEFVRTFPLADPKDIPVAPEPEKEYVPTKTEIDSVPAMTAAEWNSIPSSVATRRYALDWKFKVAVDKLAATEKAEQDAIAAKKRAAEEKAALDKRREQYRKDDAEEARKVAR